MKVAFIIFTTVTMIMISWVYPLVAVARGRRLRNTVLIAWGLSVAYLFFLSGVVPCIAGMFSKRSGREVADHWVPEGTGIAGMMCVGWMFPLLFGTVGGLI